MRWGPLGLCAAAYLTTLITLLITSLTKEYFVTTWYTDLVKIDDDDIHPVVFGEFISMLVIGYAAWGFLILEDFYKIWRETRVPVLHFLVSVAARFFAAGTWCAFFYWVLLNNSTDVAIGTAHLDEDNWKDLKGSSAAFLACAFLNVFFVFVSVMHTSYFDTRAAKDYGDYNAVPAASRYPVRRAVHQSP